MALLTVWRRLIPDAVKVLDVDMLPLILSPSKAKEYHTTNCIRNWQICWAMGAKCDAWPHLIVRGACHCNVAEVMRFLYSRGRWRRPLQFGITRVLLSLPPPLLLVTLNNHLYGCAQWREQWAPIGAKSNRAGHVMSNWWFSLLSRQFTTPTQSPQGASKAKADSDH